MGPKFIFDRDRHIVIFDSPYMEPIELPTMELIKSSDAAASTAVTDKKNRMKSILKRRKYSSIK